MNLFSSMRISSSGMSAERLRVNLISSNLANANVTRGEDGKPYKRLDASFKNLPTGFDNFLDIATQDGRNAAPEVEVDQVYQSPTFKRVYEPSHPDADAEGYVTMPDINPVEEMVDMIMASRSYEANVSVSTTAKGMIKAALSL